MFYLVFVIHSQWVKLWTLSRPGSVFDTGSCLWLAFQMSRECFRAIGQWDLLARSDCPLRHSPLYILAGFRDSYLYPTANVHLESQHYRKKGLDLFSGNVRNPKSDGKGRVGLRKRKTFRLTSCHLIRKKKEKQEWILSEVISEMFWRIQVSNDH